MDLTTFREGIWALQTRRFGSIAELMLERILTLKRGRSLFHDLYDELQSQRVEVKFSRVQSAAEATITGDTVLSCIQRAAAGRAVPYSNWESHRFDCNIQQIKRAEFDVLYYGLFFADRIVIFRIASDEIATAGIGYSDKQHKGNIGEGQFHISQRTLQGHLDRFSYQHLSYEELFSLLTTVKE